VISKKLKDKQAGLFLCWHKAETNRDVLKVYVFDEAWSHLLSKQGALLLMGLFRTIRKYMGMVFAITQDITDLSESRYKAAIMANIGFFYVLEQSKASDLKTLQKTLNLSDHKMKMIAGIHSEKGYYSEAFIRTPEINFIGQIVPTGYEYWLATTDPDDLVIFNKTMNQNGQNLFTTLEQLADKYPHGAAA
jgi:conjugal transfer ATP-binding protein TraC